MSDEIFSNECPTRDVLDRIATKWGTLIVIALMTRPKRFGTLKRQVQGISQKMLTQTLRGLERDGLATRTVLPTSPVQVEYALTDLGKSIGELLAVLRSWSEAHIDEINASRLDFDDRHAQGVLPIGRSANEAVPA